MISVNLSSIIGGFATFLEIVATAFIGIAILVNFRKTLVENMTGLSYNFIDLEQFQRLNLFSLFGAILLIVPGFLTDIIGVLMQFGVITSMLVNRYHVKSDGCKRDSFAQNNLKKDSDVIDVEIIDSHTLSK